jgi:hypothetical protein
MATHDYTAKGALKLLLSRIESRSPALAKRIREAINTGKAELKRVAEPSESGRGPKRRRQYWQVVPFTDEEALQVAQTVIESHLLETRLLLNTAAGEFAIVGELPPKPVKLPTTSGSVDTAQFALESEPKLDREEIAKPENLGIPKRLTIDAEPEQLQEKQRRDDLLLESVSTESIEALRSALDRLQDLMNFNGKAKHGNTR